MTYRPPLLFLLMAILLSACGSSDDDSGSTNNVIPVANEIVTTMEKNATKNITLDATDQDNDDLTYIIVTHPSHGSVSINGNIATYTPTAGYSGSDSFTYKVNDGTADSNAATVGMVIRAASVTNEINNPPVAQEVIASTTENTAVTITLGGTDSDGDSLSYIKVTNPNHGSVTINGNIATYTPTAGYSGSDSFTYKVNDGTADSDTATVGIVIRAASVTGSTNNLPVAQDVNATTTENTAVTITLRGTDSDGDSLRYVKVTDPTQGTISISGNTATYTPTAGYSGSDSFTYKVNDGTADSNTATVSITINADNTAPIANAGINQSDWEGASFTLHGSGTDDDGDSLTYQWQQTDSTGVTIALSDIESTTPSWTAPEVSRNTTLHFTLTVTDSNGGTATDTVEVTINNLAINDPILRRCFGEYIPSGVELYQLTRFSCDGRLNLKLADANLSELKKLPHLTSLSLEGGGGFGENISDISVLSTLTRLTELSLVGNDISDIGKLSALSNLTLLSLRSNQLTDISPLDSMTNTFDLYIGGNCIPFEAISALPSNITVYGADEQAECPTEFTASLVAQHSFKCLDIRSGSTTKGAEAIQYACNGDANQLFDFIPARGKEEVYTIKAQHSGLCLDIEHGSTETIPSNSPIEDHAKLIQWTCNGGTNQQFRLNAKGHDIFEIQAIHSEQCLDVYGGEKENSVNVIQFSCNHKQNQRWKLNLNGWIY